MILMNERLNKKINCDYVFSIYFIYETFRINILSYKTEEEIRDNFNLTKSTKQLMKNISCIKNAKTNMYSGDLKYLYSYSFLNNDKKILFLGTCLFC